jgi:methionyl-tRNA formyltransferase
MHYPVLLRPPLLSSYSTLVNVHPGYLPWGRGYHPVFWSLWEETPAGATIHHMSEKVDCGPLVDQIRVEYTSSDTSGTLHQRVREAEKNLFRTYWPMLVRGELLPAMAQTSDGSAHTRQEFLELKENVHWESMDAAELVRLARPRT